MMVEATRRLKPYYEDVNCAIYLGDAASIIPVLPANIADVMVTDPPYGQAYRSNKNIHRFIVGDEKESSMADILDAAARRALKHGRHAYIFGSPDLEGTCLTAKAELVWDKQSPGLGDLSLHWATSHETIAFAVAEISQANRETGAGNLAARLRRGSVVRAPKRAGGSAHRHPTEKPVAILREMIESSSMLGETVIDPFVGSGSTLEAAALEGRYSIGIEIDEGYCKTAADRMADILPKVPRVVRRE